VLKTHAGSYVAIAALAALASTQRQKMGCRRWTGDFSGNKYDAQQLFREIVEEIRRVRRAWKKWRHEWWDGWRRRCTHKDADCWCASREESAYRIVAAAATVGVALDGLARDEQIDPAGADAGVPRADYTGGNRMAGAATAAGG